MPLDPHAASIVEMIAKSGFPPIWQITPDEARKGWAAFARAFQAEDEPIGRVEDGTLPGPAGRLSYRLYLPAAMEIEDAGPGPQPGILYFHGGGFVLGSIATHDALCRILANGASCRVLSVEYRLAPEHKFPAAVDDAFHAAVWVAEHGGEVGIDPRRVAIAGDSAGATLAAVVCQMARSAGRTLAALQVLFCPATDCVSLSPSRQAFAGDAFLERRALGWFLDRLVEPGADLSDPRLSPLRIADAAGLPAAHVHTAEFDPLRDEGRAYADRLAAAGVPVRYTCHPGMPHPFCSMTGAIPYARQALAQAGAAIGRALGEGGERA